MEKYLELMNKILHLKEFESENLRIIRPSSYKLIIKTSKDDIIIRINSDNIDIKIYRTFSIDYQKIYFDVDDITEYVLKYGRIDTSNYNLYKEIIENYEKNK